MIKSFLGRLRENKVEEKTNLLRNFLNELINGERYEIGEPWQLTSQSLSAVIPICRTFDQDRNYLVLQEITNDKITVTDSGRINRVNVALKSVKRPVFARVGTIFKGKGTQSRTSGMSVVLGFAKENSIRVFCVDRSHGISALCGFSAMFDVVPRKVEDVLASPLKSQAMVWRAAAVKSFRGSVKRCPRCGSSSLLQTYEAEPVCMHCGYRVGYVARSRPTIGVGTTRFYSPSAGLRDDLVANLDEMTKFNEKVEDTLSRIPADINNQVGVVIIDSRGVLGLEMFDHPDSWRAFSNSIVRNYADILAKERAQDGLFTLRTDRVSDAIRKFFEKAQKTPETSIFKNKIGETRMLSGEFVGEYTTIDSEVIHLILKRRNTQMTSERERSKGYHSMRRRR